MVGSNTPPDGPAVNAVEAWNDVLNTTGVEFEITDVLCGSGGDCIEMQTTTETIAGCADITPSSINQSSGYIDGVSIMRFPASTWSNASDSRLQRGVAHELGHVLGLANNTCSNVNTLMGPASSCTSTDTGMALGPTTSDVLPVVKSTYGNQVRATCGF
jgi:hypothetical protein